MFAIVQKGDVSKEYRRNSMYYVIRKESCRFRDVNAEEMSMGVVTEECARQISGIIQSSNAPSSPLALHSPAREYDGAHQGDVPSFHWAAV